jgi:hypothetical protein
MYESKRMLAVAAALALVTFATPAAAQTDPKFAFAKADEVKPGAPVVPPVEWKVQAKAGMNVTTGNSQTTNGTAGLSASRKEGNNKLALDGNIAYGRSNILVPVFGDAAMPTVITALDRNQVTSTNNWMTKGRYDRFFTLNNAGYAMGLAAADKIAGKRFAGGGQVGYSRQLIKDEKNILVAEIGYDFSYESYVQQPMKTIDPVTIHSARIFVGETLKLTPATGINASVEAFFNLNNETKAVNVNNGTAGVAPFKDTRVIGKLGFSTTLLKSLSAAVGFTLRYDQNPAPRPIPSGSPAGSSYAQTGAFPAGGPFADKTDTLTEVTLIYTFL